MTLIKVDTETSAGGPLRSVELCAILGCTPIFATNHKDRVHHKPYKGSPTTPLGCIHQVTVFETGRVKVPINRKDIENTVA